MVQHHLPTDFHLKLHACMVAHAVGVHLDAEVAVLRSERVGPSPPVLAFGFGDGRVHGVVNPPWFFAHPCRDVFIIDLDVFRQAAVERGVEGQPGVRPSVCVTGRQHGNAPQSKPEVSQEVNPAHRGFARLADARPRGQASWVQAHARSSHGAGWRALLQGCDVSPRCPCPSARLRSRGCSDPNAASTRG